MRKLLFLLALLGLTYAGWQWLYPGDAPTRLIDRPVFQLRDSRPEVTVSHANGSSFRLLPAGADGGYLAIRGAIQATGIDDRASGLLRELRNLRIDSLSRGGRPFGESVHLELSGANERERVEFIFPLRGEGPVVAAYFGQPDYFALAPTKRDLRPLLEFDHFRDRRLTRVNHNNRGADSILLVRGDSMRVRLRGKVGAEAVMEIIAPASAPFADFFDELEFADRRLGDLLVYQDSQPHRVGLYRDSSWLRPYVLASRIYPRRYLSVDSLPALKLGAFDD